jgi:nitrite reductase/ring-hydroxylating ferredoxin subunit
MTEITDTVTRTLGRADEIPVGEGRAYVVDGEQIAIFRLRNGELRAVSAVCTHAGGPIADGQIDGDIVICPLHQNTFDLATGCSLTGRPALRTYPVHLGSEGNLVISLSP